jgi:hypothetical protein
VNYKQLELPLNINGQLEFITLPNNLKIPLPEKIYQKDLVYLLSKTTEYLGWKVFSEHKTISNTLEKRFLDIVIQRKHKQPLILELKNKEITIDILNKVVHKDYLNSYRNKHKRFPVLIIIGTSTRDKEECTRYIKNFNLQMEKVYPKHKNKPILHISDYAKLTQFIENELLQSKMSQWELDRIKRDCSLLYGGACKQIKGETK